MASVSVQDAISALERFADEVPQELRDDEQLRKRLFDAVQKLVPEVETPPEMCQRLLYSVCPDVDFDNMRESILTLAS